MWSGRKKGGTLNQILTTGCLHTRNICLELQILTWWLITLFVERIICKSHGKVYHLVVTVSVSYTPFLFLAYNYFFWVNDWLYRNCMWEKDFGPESALKLTVRYGDSHCFRNIIRKGMCTQYFNSICLPFWCHVRFEWSRFLSGRFKSKGRYGIMNFFVILPVAKVPLLNKINFQRTPVSNRKCFNITFWLSILDFEYGNHLCYVTIHSFSSVKMTWKVFVL